MEELKADLADVKQMYREQIDMLVNQVGICLLLLSTCQNNTNAIDPCSSNILKWGYSVY